MPRHLTWLGSWTSHLSQHGKTISSQGADNDTLAAWARAYIGALNKLLTKRERTALVAMLA